MQGFGKRLLAVPSSRLHSAALFAAAFLFAVLFAASCAVAPDFSGLSARSYAEVGTRGLRLDLLSDRSVAWGGWEDPGSDDFGLIEGRVDGAGAINLRLYPAGAASPPASIEGTLSDAGRRIAGMYIASRGGVPRRLTLQARSGPAGDPFDGLALRRAEAGRHDGSGLQAPELFRAVGLEPEEPARLRDWYRATFQGGESLGRMLELRKDAFVASYRSAIVGDSDAGVTASTVARLSRTLGISLPQDSGGPAANPGSARRPSARWTYQSRQFVLFRSPTLLSIGTRTSSYVGGLLGTMETSFAAIDTDELRILGPDDFLQGDWRSGLAPLLTARLRRELGLAPGASLVASGFDSESIRPGEAFAVAPTGLAFYYAPGTIATRDSGEFWLFLDWADLGPYLKGGILGRYGLSAGTDAGGGG